MWNDVRKFVLNMTFEKQSKLKAKSGNAGQKEKLKCLEYAYNTWTVKAQLTLDLCTHLQFRFKTNRSELVR